MTWMLSESLAEYTAAASGFLAEHPVRNTVLLTIAHRLSNATDDAPAPRFGWWRPAEGGPVQGAFVQTRPQPMQLGLMPPQAAVELAARLAGEPLTGVSGDAAATEPFAEAWVRATGGGVRVRQRMCLYRLGTLAVPQVSGRLRPADASDPADRALATDWFKAFDAEVGSAMPDAARMAERRLAEGAVHFWEDGGRPVALGGVSSLLAGMVRIGPVYTPPDLRGRGYGGAVTAGVSIEGLARGADDVLLHADLANPTSNSVYRRLGYLPVGRTAELEFTA
ncbi:GNAT superfamily N-acetyltransferase [Kitasatospora sp. MAA4]|uniref:GNAT family N-acetyltransferase n=1 Tax=Kitasatospora sp. MAA4 TaxID=3035093 RepID=UPI00247604A4|nr:GNAT family N-acetyltransferase [Kitasatospora sp. MAA4]MDH6134967.1 GNAT superfamily N-acetyltransferase [Kitasatospora sp. MAA4]